MNDCDEWAQPRPPRRWGGPDEPIRELIARRQVLFFFAMFTAVCWATYQGY